MKDETSTYSYDEWILGRVYLFLLQRAQLQRHQQQSDADACGHASSVAASQNDSSTQQSVDYADKNLSQSGSF